MLNTNDKKRQQNAAIEYNIKLILEASLGIKIRSEFNRLINEFRREFGNNNLFPNITNHQERVKQILLAHYKKVSNRFRRQIIRELGTPPNNQEIQYDIDNDINSHHNIRANASSNIIANTSRNDITDSISEAQNQATKRGELLTGSALALAATAIYRRKMLGRVETITATETNNPAEQAKQAEVDALHNNNAKFDGEDVSERIKQKEWVAILDSHTREAHAEADSQIVPFNEPYIVGGQRLMYPSDMSLGATIGNVANCRCSSIIIIR